MMTQMVLSRGSIFPLSVPDVAPSIHPSKQAIIVENEDVTVMDTKLKIIEILQVKSFGLKFKSNKSPGFSSVVLKQKDV